MAHQSFARQVVASAIKVVHLAASAAAVTATELYHHLKALTGAGGVEPDTRGSYRLPSPATIPALVLVTAAADVAGQLR